MAYNYSLSGLPTEILNLPSTCYIELTGCGLSPTVIERLRAAADAPGYQGPRISYSIREASRDNSNQSVEELLKGLYGDAGQPYERLSNIPGEIVTDKTLQPWLSRLSYMKDYSNSPARKQWLVTNILKYLKLAAENLEFRRQFAAIINDASETCGDRMALSILHLGIAYKLATVDLRDMKALADFLGRGVWAIEMLEVCARQKISTFLLFDEIEVYLAYPVMLKERLHLPIDVEEMLYFGFSALTAGDLNAAEGFVNGSLTNKEAYYNFLIHHDKWKEALVLNYPVGYANLERSKDQETEAAVTEDAYEAIKARYETGLIELTKKALES